MAFNLTAQLSVALNTASLKNAANTINSQLKDVGAVSLGIPKNDADNLRYIKVQAAEASTAMEQFGRQSGLAAKRFVAFTLTAGAIITFTSSLKQALTAAVDFDREMIRLTQVSTDSVGQVGAVGNEVTRLSKNYGVSSKDLLTTAVTLKQANLSLADTKVALEALAQAALAPSFDNLRDTTEGAIAVMNQFGISAKDLGNALGSINAVAAEFAVEAQDLIEGVRKAGGAFKAAGGDLNEFLALFTSIRQTTRESAESIGTGLRTIFTRVQRNETVEALKDIGVQLRYTAEEAKAAGDLGLANQFVGPYEAVKRLSGALNELRSTDPRFSAIIEELGGYRQISKVIPLIQEFGVAQKALGVAQIGGASLALNAAQAQEAFGVKIQKVKEEFADFIRNLTNTSSFRSLIDLLLGAASAGIALADSLKGVLPVITAIAAVKTVQSLTGFAKGFGSTAFSPAPASQPSTFSPFLPTGGKKASGGIIKMAKGGVVPGVGRGDKVPALLEPGELVIPRSRFGGGGSIEADQFISKELLLKLFDSSKTPKDKDYRDGTLINPNDTVKYNIISFPLEDQKSAKLKSISAQGNSFEIFAAERLAASRTKPGFPVDLIGKIPYEVKNVGEAVSDAELVDKLARYQIRIGNQKKLSNSIEKDNLINLGTIGVVYNTAKFKEGEYEQLVKDKNYTQGDPSLANTQNQKLKLTEQQNSVLKTSKLPQKKAFGGLVPGVGNTDSVPLDLPIGSYVVRKSSVAQMGASNLSRLGRASGGVIPSLVMPGEYIYTPDETKKIGVSNLNHINKTGRQKFGTGRFVGYDSMGVEVRDTVDAATEAEALAKIRQMGYFVTEFKWNESKKKRGSKTVEPPDPDREDPYKDLKKRDRKLAKQIEGQFRIPTNLEGQIENEEQAKEKVKEIRASGKRVKELKKTRTSAAGDVERGLKKEESLTNTRAGFIKDLDERQGILTKAKNEDEEARRIQKKHYDAAANYNRKAEVLATQKLGAEASGDFAKSNSIQKRIDALKQKEENATARAVKKQETVDATTETRLLAEENITKTRKNIETIDKSIETNAKNIEANRKKEATAAKQERKERKRFDTDKDGNVTERGKVITSTYGDGYKKEVQKELDNYKKVYGEEATGGSRKAVRESVSQRMKAGYFNQIKSFSEAKGLEFNEDFANKQAQQMARETAAGRRKFEVSDKGEFYDPTLANRLKKEGYTETGKKGAYRTTKDFLKNTFSKDNLQNNIFAASTGLGIIGGSIDMSDAKAKEAVSNKDEARYIRGGGTAGGFTGLAAGASVGSFLGPWGIAFGAATGLMIGISTGLRDAEKQIADIKLEQAGTQLKNAFSVAATAFGKIAATTLREITDLQDKIDEQINNKAAAEVRTFSTENSSVQLAKISAGERRSQYAGQAAGINSLLSKQIEEEIKSSISFDEKANLFKPRENQKFNATNFLEDSTNALQLGRLSIGLDQPIEKLKKQFETFAKDFEKQQLASKNQTIAVKSTEQLNIAFSLLANASSNAASTLNNLSPAFQTITDALSSNFSISQKRRISTDVQSSFLNPNTFNQNLKDVSSGLGSSGANFQKSGEIVSNISSLLPDILSQINPNDVKGGKDPQSVLRSNLTQQLTEKGFDPSQVTAYVNSIVGKMGEDFSKMLSESGGDYGEFAKKIMSGVSEPFLKAYQNIAADLEKASDAYVSGINKLAQETLKTVQEFDKLSKIQQQTRNFKTNIDIENEIKKQKKANPLGARFGEIKEGQIGLDLTNISDQTKAFAEQQAKLTGLNNGDQLDPQQIQDRINQNRINTEAAEAKRKNARFTAGANGRGQDTDATNELGRLKVEASLLNQAMRNLADSTEEVSAIEQRVGKIRQEIANEEQENAKKQSETENKGETLLKASPEQLQRLQAGSQLTNIAKELGGNLLRFNVEQRKAIFEYLDFSGEEGKKLKSEFLQASGFVSKPETKAQDKYGPQLLQLNAQLFAAMAVREQAQSLIIKDQQTLQGQFFAQLAMQNEEFFTRLSANLTRTQIGGQEQSIRTNDARIKELQSIAPSVGLINNTGVSQDDYKNLVAPRSKDISAFLGSIEQQKTIKSKNDDFFSKDFEQQKIIASGSRNKDGTLNIQSLIGSLAANKNLAGLDINKIVQDVQKSSDPVTGKIDFNRLSAAISGAVSRQFGEQNAKAIQAQFNLSDKIGLKRIDDGKGNYSFEKSGEKELSGLGDFVLKLVDQKTSGLDFSKAVDDIQRLGGFIGQGFTNQILDLQLLSNNAAVNLQNLNAQLNLLNVPRNPVAPVNPVAPRLPAFSTGGMVSHASAIVGADPKVFKPIGPDTIPAMLNHGEYVVNAKATSENLPLLQALNGGGTVKPTKAMNDGGPVKYLADGAFVDPAAAALGAPLNVNRIEAQRIARMQRDQNVAIAVLTKFGNLRGSWRRNALNNSLRIMQGDDNLTNIPYRDGSLPISAVVSKQNIAPWSMIKNISDTGLNIQNLNPQKLDKINRMAIGGQIYAMPLAIKQVPYQQILDATEDYLRANRNAMLMGVQAIDPVDNDGNSRAYYERRANLKPYFEDLLMAGSPPETTTIGAGYFERTYGLKDVNNIKVIGFSKGGQAGGRTPAMVQSGEFIVGADKAKKNKGLLDYMNGGGKVSYLSLGGEADEFMRNSWNPGENALYDSLKGVGRLKIKRTDPIRLGAVGEMGPQIPRETASYRDYTRHYLGEGKAAQISRVLDRSPELDDNAPTTRLRKTSIQLDAMLRSGELDTLSELSAGIFRKKYDVATTYPQGNSMLEIDTLRHEFGGHGAQYAAEIEGSRLNNSTSGSFDMEGLANDKKPTRFLAELHARMVQLKDPLARFEMFKYFSTSNGAAAAYGSSPWLGKDGRGWHEDALKYANENDGLVQIDDLLKGRGKGKEVMLIEEIMRRAGKDTSVTTQIDGKTYLDTKKAFGFKPMPTVKLSAADEIVRNTFAGTESSVDRSVQPKKTGVNSDFFSNPDSYYRVIHGQEALDDVKSGTVRTNADTKVSPDATLAEKMKARPTDFPSFSKGQASMAYAGQNENHTIIVSDDPSIQPSTSGRHGKGSTYFPTIDGKHQASLNENFKAYRHIGNGQYELVYTSPKTPTEVKGKSPSNILKAGAVGGLSLLSLLGNQSETKADVKVGNQNLNGPSSQTPVENDQFWKNVMNYGEMTAKVVGGAALVGAGVYAKNKFFPKKPNSAIAPVVAGLTGIFGAGDAFAGGGDKPPVGNGNIAGPSSQTSVENDQFWKNIKQWRDMALDPYTLTGLAVGAGVLAYRRYGPKKKDGEVGVEDPKKTGLVETMNKKISADGKVKFQNILPEVKDALRKKFLSEAIETESIKPTGKPTETIDPAKIRETISGLSIPQKLGYDGLTEAGKDNFIRNIINAQTVVPTAPPQGTTIDGVDAFKNRLSTITDLLAKDPSGNKGAIYDEIKYMFKESINPTKIPAEKGAGLLDTLRGSTIGDTYKIDPSKAFNKFIEINSSLNKSIGLNDVRSIIKQKNSKISNIIGGVAVVGAGLGLGANEASASDLKGKGGSSPSGSDLKGEGGSPPSGDSDSNLMIASYAATATALALAYSKKQKIKEMFGIAESKKVDIENLNAGKTGKFSRRVAGATNAFELALPFAVDPLSNWMNDYSVEDIQKGFGESLTDAKESFPMMAGMMGLSLASKLFAAGVGMAFLPQTSDSLQQLGDVLSTDKSSAGKQQKVISKYGGVFPGVQELFDKQAKSGPSSDFSDKQGIDPLKAFGDGQTETTFKGDAARVLGTVLSGGVSGGAAFGLPGAVIGATAGLLIASYKIYRDAQAQSFKKEEMQKAIGVRKNLQGRYNKRGQGNFSPDFFDKYDNKQYVDYSLNKPQEYFNNFSDEIESYGIYSDPEFKNLKSNKYLNQYPFSAVPDAVLAEKLESDKKGSIEAFMSEISELQKNLADEKSLKKVRDRYRADYSTAFLDGKTKNESVLDSDKADVFSKLFINKDTNISSLKDKILNDRKNESRIAEIATRLGIVPEKELSTYDFEILKKEYDGTQDENLDLNQIDNRIRTNNIFEMMEKENAKKILKSLKVEPDFIKKFRSPEYINAKSGEISNIRTEKNFEIPPSYNELRDGNSAIAEIQKAKNQNEEKIKKLKEEMETDLFGGVYAEQTTVEDLKSYIDLMLTANKELFYQDSNNGFSSAEGRPISNYEGIIPQRIKNTNRIDFKNINKSLASSGRNKEIVQAFYGNKLFDNKDQDILSYINKGFEGDVLDETDFYNFDGNQIRKELKLEKLSDLSSKDILEYFLKNKDIGYSWNGQKQPLALASGGIVPSSAPNPDPSFFKAKGSDTVPAILSPGEYVVNARATSANLPLLQNLNSGGAVKYLYRGGNLTAINPFYAAYSGQSPGRGYISSETRYNNLMDARADRGFGIYDPVSGGRSRPTRYEKRRTDFDIGQTGYQGLKVFNPRSNANTLNNLANYAADRTGSLNKPGYGRYTFNTSIGQKHLKEFGSIGNYGNISFGGGPIPNYVGGLNALSNSPYGSAKMAGASKFAMEDAVFNDILNNKEISRAPITGYRTSAVGSSYISGLIGGPQNHGDNGQNYDKVSLNDYINELGFSKAGNQSFQGVSANKALASGSLADVPGSNVGIAQQAISRLQKDGLGRLSVNNTDVAASTALDVIKNARISQANEPYQEISPPRPAPNPYYDLANSRNNKVQGNRVFSSGPSYFKGFANGGSSTDTQPAMLTPGEFVVSRPAVDRVGTAFLDRVNNYAKGGPVGYYQTGTGPSSGGGVTLGVDFKILQSALASLQGAAGPVASGALQLGTNLVQAAGTITSSISLIDQIGAIIRNSSSSMRDSSNALSASLNNLSASLDRIPKTITLAIAPLSLNVNFNTPSILLALQQSVANITTNVAGMIDSAIRNNNNDQMNA